MKVPKIVFSICSVSVKRSGNCSACANSDAFHFSYTEFGIELRKRSVHLLLLLNTNRSLMTDRYSKFTVFCSPDFFIKDRKSCIPSIISAATLARSISNPFIFLNNKFSLRFSQKYSMSVIRIDSQNKMASLIFLNWNEHS